LHHEKGIVTGIAVGSVSDLQMVADRAGRDGAGFDDGPMHRGKTSVLSPARLGEQRMQPLDGRQAGKSEGLEHGASDS